jgi:hypothetical protein
MMPGMTSRLETDRPVQHLMRLRRALRHADDDVRLDLELVLAYLERTVGATVSRAETARLLGISYPSLNRWIEKGDIPVVLTPSGKREIALSQVVDLLEELETGDDVTLADVIRERRRKAEEIPEEDFLPPRRRSPRTHRLADMRSLAYHRLVATRLDQDVVAKALRRLRRWEDDGRIDPRWAETWEDILAMPLERIARAITADTERGRAIRQSSPFAGTLNEHERRRVARAVEERVST